MSKSKWKVPHFDFKLYKNFHLPDSRIKVWSRNSVIPEILVGRRILIHNGNTFKRVLILREKVGFKFGLFSLTRKRSSKLFGSKLKKK